MSEKVAKLAPMQVKFVAEYLKDLHATNAAIRAGYSEKTAQEQGSRLLSNVMVQEALARAQARYLQNADVTAERVVDELALIGFSDIGDIIDFTGADPKLRAACDIPERARRAISSVKVKRYAEGSGEFAREVEVTEFKLWDKLAALEKLARRLKLIEDEDEDEKAKTVTYVEINLSVRPDGPPRQVIDCSPTD